MRRAFIVGNILAFGLAASGAANAATMTCAQFRQMLLNSISESGHKVAAPQLESPSYRASNGSSTRYDLSGIAGLSGSLFCAENDRMDNLDVSIDVLPEDGPVRVYRLGALAGAAACAVTIKPDYDRCKKMVDTLLETSVKDYSKAYVRGEVDPNGMSKATLDAGFTLEFDASAGNIDFTLRGPVIWPPREPKPIANDDDHPFVPDLKAGEGFIDSVPTTRQRR